MDYSASKSWIEMIEKIIRNGQMTHPRNFTCKEVLGNLTIFDMKNPVTLVAERQLGYCFMCAEAAWILSGDNRVETIAPFSKKIVDFSDDGIFFFGAYGPKIVGQLMYVVRKLVQDTDTRQAVLTIWRENPPETRDPPCTLALQFQIRNNQLNCFLTMRSSDAWLGVPYDVFNFSMLSGVICLLYRQQTGKLINVGDLYFYAGNQHLYDSELKQAAIIVENYKNGWPLKFGVELFEPNFFVSAADLIAHLWHLAKKEFTECKYIFLTSFMETRYGKKTE